MIFDTFQIFFFRLSRGIFAFFFCSLSKVGDNFVLDSEGNLVTEETKRQINLAIKDLKKDPDAFFASFYELTKGPLYYLILSYVHDHVQSEDIMQDTYVSFLANLSKLSLRLNPYSYLMTSGRNKALDYLKSKKSDLSLDEEGVEETVGHVENMDDAEPLLAAIARLVSPFEFRIYVEHVLSDLTFKEIAELEKRPLGTITATYSFAIAKLKKGLENYGK
jgi:RNA polymerase sigma-70 factor (ECF subfamily)